MNENRNQRPYREASFDELWQQDPMLLRMIGLAPLFVIATSTVQALGVAVAAMIVMSLSALLISLLRHQLTPILRLIMMLLVFTTLASCTALLIQVYAFALYPAIAAFVPLMIGNGVLLGRSDSFAASNPPLLATVDALKTAARFMLLLVALGAMREVLGTGALFAELDQLLPLPANWRIEIFSTAPFPLALQPTGALWLLALLCALKKIRDKRNPQSMPIKPLVTPGSKRARVTGKI